MQLTSKSARQSGGGKGDAPFGFIEMTVDLQAVADPGGDDFLFDGISFEHSGILRQAGQWEQKREQEEPLHTIRYPGKILRTADMDIVKYGPFIYCFGK